MFREKSYTSLASLADGDAIPTYGEEPEAFSFSGKRDGRNYMLGDGADVNGAGNIARKEYPEAFGGTSRDGLVKHMQEISSVRYEDLYPRKKKPENKSKYKKKANPKRNAFRNGRLNRKIQYRILFAA